MILKTKTFANSIACTEVENRGKRDGLFSC